MIQWEWMIMLVIAIGLLLAELISVRRSIRRAREEDAARDRRSPNGPNG